VHDSGDIPAPERFTFAFLGRLEADTGFDVQLAALVRLSDRSDEPMTLLVCGEGSLGGLLRDAESPRLRIVRHGAVENVRKTCGRAELIFASSYLAIFDALAMGRAVVSYAASELKSTYLRDIPEIRDCVYFAEQPGDLDLLLEEAFRDPDSRERKRRAAKKLLASLSWDRTADEHLALYRRLLERRR
jgi:glycosyltransferase involved in cell wall biosynthesis